MKNLREAMQNESGLKEGESALDQKMSYKSIYKNLKEKEESYSGSLTERAKRVVSDPAYIRRIADIKKGLLNIRVMDFVMDGVKIGMPYNG